MCAVPCCLCLLMKAADSQCLWQKQECRAADRNRPPAVSVLVQQGGCDRPSCHQARSAGRLTSRLLMSSSFLAARMTKSDSCISKSSASLSSAWPALRMWGSCRRWPEPCAGECRTLCRGGDQSRQCRTELCCNMLGQAGAHQQICQVSIGLGARAHVLLALQHAARRGTN